MAQGCGCSGSTGCSCYIIAGNNKVSVTGSGSQADPIVITPTDTALIVVDSATIDLELGGDGIQGNPWSITASLKPLPLDGLSDVVVTGTPTTGYVLAYNGTNWAPVPPTTASVGSINTGNGISGAGTSGSPLIARLLSGGRLRFSGADMDVTLDTYAKLGLAFASATARDNQWTTWGIAPSAGDKAWLSDRSTLTVRGASKWWEFTPEINQTWWFPRSYPNDDAASFTGTGNVANGTIDAALAGRYRIDYWYTIQTLDSAPFATALAGLSINSVQVDSMQQDAPNFTMTGHHAFVYSHGGGDMIMNLLITIPASAVYLGTKRVGAGILVTYLGR